VTTGPVVPPAIAPVIAPVILAIDLGTSTLELALVATTGEIVWSRSVELTTRLLPGGGAEQDAEEWWRSVVSAAHEGVAALDAAGRTVSDVAAIATTGQWSSTVPTDGTGRPAGPCLLWMDSRGGALVRRRIGGPVVGYGPGHLLAWVRRTAGAPSLDGADPIGHRLHLAAAAPRPTVRWLLEPVDHLGMRLTGRAGATQVSMVGSWLIDNRRRDPGRYHPDLVRRAGIDAATLPPLVPNGSVLGPLSPSAADELGLPAGLPVLTGLPDAHAIALGAGAVDLQRGYLSIGTTSWISCHVPAKKTDPWHQVISVPSTLPGRYLVLDNHETSGRSLHWLRAVLADGDQVPSFAELDRLAARSPQGAGGVLFTPWLAGERTPIGDRNARAGFHNLSLRTTRADLVRAVLEGVAFNERWSLRPIERFVGRRLDPLRIVGGGAVSSLWCQIYADILERTVEQVAHPASAAARGAALQAALTLGLIGVEQVPDAARVVATMRPDPATAAIYRRLFAEFPGLYRRQRRMFARLNGSAPS